MKIPPLAAAASAIALCLSIASAEPSPSWAELYVVDLARGVVGLTTSPGDMTLIYSVDAGTPAAAAGLHLSEHIVEIDGRSTADIKDFRDLRIRMDGAPESVVALTVASLDGRTRVVPLKRIPLGSVPRVKLRPNTLLSYCLI